MGRQDQKTQIINGRNYQLVEILSKKNGLRYKVSFKGKFFSLLILPEGPETWQHVRALNRLAENNRNYPRVIEHERCNGEIRLVTSWIEGFTLQWYLNRGRSQPEHWPSVAVTVKLIRGLAHALFFTHHHTNLVHMDLKPANLVLTRFPETLVMIDFGSALAVETAVKRVDGDGITFGYAAPEIWSMTPNFQADLFSVSVIAFEMLTGQLPYEGLGGKIGHPDFRPATIPAPEQPSMMLKHARTYPKAFLRTLDEAITTGLMLNRGERFSKPSQFREAWDEVYRTLNDRWLDRLIRGIGRWFR